MSEKQNRTNVAKVILVRAYEEQVVINKGAADGTKINDLFLIYELGEEMFDPETEESLGKLEIVKGRGKVIHVQEKISTIESIEKTAPQKKITKRKERNPFTSFNNGYEEEVINGEGQTVPFDNPKRGDFAKLIR